MLNPLASPMTSLLDPDPTRRTTSPTLRIYAIRDS